MSKINKYSFVKSLMFSFLALFILVGMYGGCGSSGGGNNPPPTNPPPTNPPPTDPPPTNPPPTQPPPSECQIPSLNTDFSDVGYFFVDDFTNILIGVTSTGNDVVMTLSDIPDSGAILGIFGGVTSADTCLIDTLVIDDLLFPASGLCVRSNNGATFSVLDFESLGVELVDVIGQCDTVVPLGTAQFSLEENLIDTSSRIAQDLNKELNQRGSDTEENESIISDFMFDLGESVQE
ncbi:MAG: hypothetical protein DHS20C13_29550 [Thermodesulfobacteriota bacterium]|nr:MAG: hypothetical protein DHS20C13_29550 [Thermodesulfobacteriota bacterium]